MDTDGVKGLYLRKICKVTGVHCVEMVSQATKQYVGVKDVRAVDSQPLIFNADEWRRFIQATKAGWSDL